MNYLTKEGWLEMWKLSGDEGERAWEQKQAMETRNSAAIMPDIQPYKSMVTGEMIEGRAQHRNHMKKHDLIEIGNETKHLKPKVKSTDFGDLRKRLHEVVDSKLH